MFLGSFELCLNVKDVRRSVEYYETLGFKRVGGNLADQWAILEHSNLRLGLFQGHIESNLINFRGGDVFRIAETMKQRGIEFAQDAYREPDGSAGAICIDPDGNAIYFNTFPEEQAELDEAQPEVAPPVPQEQETPGGPIVV
jgi:lactoylglutathione lyase